MTTNLLLFKTDKGDVYPIGGKDANAYEASTEPQRTGSLRRSIHDTYKKLVSKIDYHERLCSQLRHSSDLLVLYPAEMNPAEAEQKLLRFIRLCINKHTLWTYIDGLIAILGIALAPIPGPNIFFFYPAARSLGHYFASTGARKIRGLKNLRFQGDPLIDKVQLSLGEDPEGVSSVISKLEEKYNIGDLSALLKPLQEK